MVCLWCLLHFQFGLQMSKMVCSRGREGWCFILYYFEIWWPVEVYNSAAYAVQQEEKRTNYLTRLPDYYHNSHSANIWRAEEATWSIDSIFYAKAIDITEWVTEGNFQVKAECSFNEILNCADRVCKIRLAVLQPCVLQFAWSQSSYSNPVLRWNEMVDRYVSKLKQASYRVSECPSYAKMILFVYLFRSHRSISSFALGFFCFWITVNGMAQCNPSASSCMGSPLFSG